MWQEVIKFLGGSSLLLAAVAWLIKSLINQVLEKDIKIFQNDLKAQSEKEVVILKSQLSLEAQTQKIKFAMLHERRALIIEKLYQKLRKLQSAGQSLAVEFDINDSDFQGNIREKSDELIDKYSEVSEYIKLNRIYFSNELINHIENFYTNSFNASLEIFYELIKTDKKKFIDEFIKDNERYEQENSLLLVFIEAEFRKILGV